MQRVGWINAYPRFSRTSCTELTGTGCLKNRGEELVAISPGDGRGQNWRTTRRQKNQCVPVNFVHEMFKNCGYGLFYNSAANGSIT